MERRRELREDALLRLRVLHVHGLMQVLAQPEARLHVEKPCPKRGGDGSGRSEELAVRSVARAICGDGSSSWEICGDGSSSWGDLIRLCGDGSSSGGNDGDPRAPGLAVMKPLSSESSLRKAACAGERLAAMPHRTPMSCEGEERARLGEMRRVV